MVEIKQKLPQYLLDLCREFRKHPTNTEVMLWNCVRDRRLNGHKFRRQHAIGRYVVDFYCHEARLILEIDGKIHDSAARRNNDIARQKFLEDQGYSIIRVSAADVRRNLEGVLMYLIAEMADRILSSQI